MEKYNLTLKEQGQEEILKKGTLEENEKVKVYKGIKIKNYHGIIENVPYTSFEAYKKFTQDTYKHEFVGKEPELFLCGLFKVDGNLSGLFNFREGLAKEKGYRNLLNREEIAEKLKENYIVAVKGLGEIETIEELI